MESCTWPGHTGTWNALHVLLVVVLCHLSRIMSCSLDHNLCVGAVHSTAYPAAARSRMRLSCVVRIHTTLHVSAVVPVIKKWTHNRFPQWMEKYAVRTVKIGRMCFWQRTNPRWSMLRLSKTGRHHPFILTQRITRRRPMRRRRIQLNFPLRMPELLTRQVTLRNTNACRMRFSPKFCKCTIPLTMMVPHRHKKRSFNEIPLHIPRCQAPYRTCGRECTR